MAELNDDELFPNSPNDYKGDYYTHLLEQYRIYVQTAEQVTERRIKSNTFFLGANSLLLSTLGILSKFELPVQLEIWWPYIATIGGIVFSFAWLLFVKSYRQLNTSKFEIINAIERKLPSTPFIKEWKLLNSGSNWKKYTKLTVIETIVPTIFAVLYIALIMGALTSR